MEPSPGLGLACVVAISDLGGVQEREIELERARASKPRRAHGIQRARVVKSKGCSERERERETGRGIERHEESIPMRARTIAVVVVVVGKHM